MTRFVIPYRAAACFGVASLALLAACSSGPGEADIKQAVEKALVLPGLGKMVEVLAVRKLGCDSSGSGYDCEVEIRIKTMGQEQTTVSRARFVKGSDGRWVMSR